MMEKNPTYEELMERVRELELAAEKHREIERTLDQQAQILSSIKDTIVIITPEMKTIYANQTAKEIFGDRPEMSTEPCYRFFKNRDTICEDCPVLKTVEDEKPHQSIMKSFDKNGEEMWRFNMAFPFYDRDGHVIAGIEIVTDYTPQKRTEAALLESEERYRTLFDNMSNAVAIYEAKNDGEDFTFIDFNKAGERIENIHRSALIGKSVLEVFPALKEFGPFDVFKRVWKTGMPEHHPIAMYKDERIAGWRDNFVYKLPSGEVVAIYSDETERKQAEEALQESEEKFRQITETVREVFWVGSPDWSHIHYVSPAYEEVWGRSCKSLYEAPLSWLDAVHEEDREPVLAAINTRASGVLDHPAFPEYRVVRSDGSLRWISARAYPVYDENNRVVRIAGIAEDITGLKRVEETLVRRSEFERLISEISSEFLGLSSDEMDGGIERALAAIGTFSGADRAYVFLFHDHGGGG
ncbi:MAG: PAS domain S-box protein [Deltaproteobacteria bacterium]|nr:PAS domain S-box protein [Deltaproteobacteria bacterium]